MTGLDEPAHQILVRLRPLRFFAEPVAELACRPAREGPESVQGAQFGKMLVPGLGPHRVVGELVPNQVELASDEIHDGRRNELARSQQAARIAEHAQLQREAQLVAGTPPGPRLPANLTSAECRRVLRTPDDRYQVLRALPEGRTWSVPTGPVPG